jgi:hypothetical protein
MGCSAPSGARCIREIATAMKCRSSSWWETYWLRGMRFITVLQEVTGRAPRSFVVSQIVSSFVSKRPWPSPGSLRLSRECARCCTLHTGPPTSGTTVGKLSEVLTPRPQPNYSPGTSSKQGKSRGQLRTFQAHGGSRAAGTELGNYHVVGVTVRRERRWTSAGATPARELVRSTR